VIQTPGSGANVRQPVLPGSPPAAKERRHAREDAGHERDSSIHLHPHADNHPSPKQVGALSNDLIQTSLRLGQNVPIVPKRFQWPTPTGMHPGGQLLEIRIGYQLRMGGSF
jgi:hypothetical protein